MQSGTEIITEVYILKFFFKLFMSYLRRGLARSMPVCLVIGNARRVLVDPKAVCSDASSRAQPRRGKSNRGRDTSSIPKTKAAIVFYANSALSKQILAHWILKAISPDDSGRCVLLPNDVSTLYTRGMATCLCCVKLVITTHSC